MANFLCVFRLVAQQIVSGEALWVGQGYDDPDTGRSIVGQIGVGLPPSATLGAWDPQVLATWGQLWTNGLFTSGSPTATFGIAATTCTQPYVFDWVRNAIRGQLLGAPNFWVSFNTNNTGTTNVGTIRIKYRVVRIGVWEFMGMLQAQQGAGGVTSN